MSKALNASLLFVLAVAFAVTFIFGFASTASAAIGTACGDTHPISGNIVQCGNGSPEMVTNGYGVMNSQVPHVQPGQTVRDAAGIEGMCPAWFTNYCVDIFGTEKYKNDARSLAKQLQSSGFTLGKYVYWLSH
jgi:hypothetical protein